MRGRLIDVVDHFTLNQSRAEDITMREVCDRELNLHGGIGEDRDTFRHDSASDVSFEVSTNSVLPEQSSALLHDDSRELFADDLFGDEEDATKFFDNLLFNETNVLNVDKDMSQDITLPPEDQPPEAYLDETQESPMRDDPFANTTTLVSDEEIGFVLEPVDVSVIEKKKQRKRKRKLMVDDLKEIPSSRMHEQLKDTSDTITTLDIAPPTELLMEWKLIGGVQWLLSHPSQPIINSELLQLFTQSQTVLRKGRQEEPAKPAIESLQHEQEEIGDLPQLEETKLTDVSSSIADDPLCIMQDLNDYGKASSDTDSSMHEEYVDGWLGNSPGGLDEEPGKPKEMSVQNDDEQHINKRTEHLLNGLRKLNQSGVTSFSLQNLCKNNKRKQVSAKFYSLLVLKKQSAVKMTQSAPYGDITVLPGPRFHSL